MGDEGRLLAGDSPLVIAHRGSSAVAPENTLPALVAAARAGAHMLEIDIQRSADGQAVVIHDATLERTSAGAGEVVDQPAEAIRALDAGSWFDSAYESAVIPVLSEVLAVMVRYPHVELLLEIKGEWTAEQLKPVLDLIEQSGLAPRVFAQSAVADTVAAVRDLAPRMRRGLLVGHLGRDVPATLALCEELAVQACNPAGLLLQENPGLVSTLQGHGMQVMVWTLNEAAQWAAATQLGVDGIITDHPERLLGWLEARALFPQPPLVPANAF